MFAIPVVVVAGALVVVGDGTVVEGAAVVVVVASVVAVSGAAVSLDVVSPSAHAEATSTRTVIMMLIRLVTGLPFATEWTP